MNYGGHYRSTPETPARAAGRRGPRRRLQPARQQGRAHPGHRVLPARRRPDPASGKRMLFHAQEYHTSFWGHMGLLNLEDHYLLPDYTATGTPRSRAPGRTTARSRTSRTRRARSSATCTSPTSRSTRRRKRRSRTSCRPTVAHGKVDYLEVMGFSDHHITAGIWYRLLNLGFRLPAGAGTDAMANYASLRGPIGLVRVFLDTDGERTPTALARCAEVRPHVRQQRSAARARVDGQRPGDVARARRQAAGARRAALAVCRGPPRARAERARDQVVQAHRRPHALRLERRRRLRRRRLGRAARLQRPAASLGARPLSLRDDEPDLLRRRRAPPAPEDAAYFVAWMDRVVEAADARGGWNSEQEKADTLAYLNARAREVPRARRTAEGAN